MWADRRALHLPCQGPGSDFGALPAGELAGHDRALRPHRRQSGGVPNRRLLQRHPGYQRRPFTYVSRLGFRYTTPVYGQQAGFRKQLHFDYIHNPLVNVVFVSNVLVGKGEVGVLGLNFHSQG